MSNHNLPLTFKEAIDMGKYQEEYLAQYDEWQQMDDHIRFQFISKAIANKRLQLRIQWANLANNLDFSKKPHLKAAQKKVEDAIHDLNDDEEELQVKYAGK